MKAAVESFIKDWLSAYIIGEVYVEPGDTTLARALAQRCRAEAMEKGISPRDLDKAARQMIPGGDDLVELIGYAVEYATAPRTTVWQEETAETDENQWEA